MKIPQSARIPTDVVENIISYVPYDQAKVDKWRWFTFFLLSNVKFTTFFFSIEA